MLESSTWSTTFPTTNIMWSTTAGDVRIWLICQLFSVNVFIFMISYLTWNYHGFNFRIGHWCCTAFWHFLHKNLKSLSYNSMIQKNIANNTFTIDIRTNSSCYNRIWLLYIKLMVQKLYLSFLFPKINELKHCLDETLKH